MKLRKNLLMQADFLQHCAGTSRLAPAFAAGPIEARQEMGGGKSPRGVRIHVGAADSHESLLVEQFVRDRRGGMK